MLAGFKLASSNDLALFRSRRRVLKAALLATLGVRYGLLRREPVAAAQPPHFEILVRHIKIPARGITLPAYLVRPAVGKHTCTALLESSLGETERDYCARAVALARQGRVVLCAERPLTPADRAAARRYLIRHPQVRCAT